MMTPAAWLAGIPVRRLVEDGLETRLAMSPGDRALAVAGSTIAPGDPLVEHLRDARVDEAAVLVAEGAAAPVSGARWSREAIGGGRRRLRELEGELLMPAAGGGERWRLVTGEHRDVITAPVGGEVLEVQPGGTIRLRVAGRAVLGAFAAGTPSRGPLALATDPFGELRPGGIDVGRAGSILVVGSRIDAEALTRARAMGVRGIVVATLPGKELRDFLASERRQQASLHHAPPFGVLVLDGSIRRPIATPVAALFERLAGTEVGLLLDPPALVFDVPDLRLADVDPDWVRVRHGPNAGAEGRVVGPGSLRRFAANVHLEAARVAIDGEAPLDIPLGDLERLA